MSGLNVTWALEELDKFVGQTTLHFPPSTPGIVDLTGYKDTAAPEEDIIKEAPVVEKIFDRVLPDWRSTESGRSNRWQKHHEVAVRVRAQLAREQELAENLGDNAPRVSASDFHPWVWSGAESLWQSGHYREAVEGAIKKLNAETQNKLGRRDLSETKLFNEAFSENPPTAGKPRLYRMSDDGSDTFRSVQRGARQFAEGVFAGIRNPLAHEVDVEMSQQQALEYLAALSILARWVDGSTLEVAR
jgi:uncharacterized protein (TIGR02391 family)